MVLILAFLLSLSALNFLAIPPNTFYCEEYARFLKFSFEAFKMEKIPQSFRYIADNAHTAFLMDGKEIIGSAFVHVGDFNFALEDNKFEAEERVINGINIRNIKSKYRDSKKALSIFQIAIRKKYRKKGYSKILMERIVEKFDPEVIALCVNPSDEYAAVNFHNYYNMNFHRMYFSNCNPDIIMKYDFNHFLKKLLRKETLLEFLDEKKKRFTYLCMYALREEFEMGIAEENRSYFEFGKNLVAKMLSYY